MSTLGSSESDVEEIRSYEEEGSSFYDDEAAHDNASGDDEEEEEDEQISASGRISEERTIEESVEQGNIQSHLTHFIDLIVTFGILSL